MPPLRSRRPRGRDASRRRRRGSLAASSRARVARHRRGVFFSRNPSVARTSPLERGGASVPRRDATRRDATRRDARRRARRRRECQTSRSSSRPRGVARRRRVRRRGCFGVDRIESRRRMFFRLSHPSARPSAHGPSPRAHPFRPSQASSATTPSPSPPRSGTRTRPR